MARAWPGRPQHIAWALGPFAVWASAESGGVSACTVMSVDYLRRRNLVLGRTYFARFRPVLRGHRFRFEFRKMLTLGLSPVEVPPPHHSTL